MTHYLQVPNDDLELFQHLEIEGHRQADEKKPVLRHLLYTFGERTASKQGIRVSSVEIVECGGEYYYVIMEVL